jgi:hypothetical protein
MAYDFTEPVTLGNGIKQSYVKIVKLVAANFTTGGNTATREVLPADASIINIKYWKKTAFSGGSVSAVALNIVNAATGTSYVTSLDLHTPTAGSQALVPMANVFQQADGNRIDMPLNFVGTATTGNPTAGEVYITIEYVR